MNRTALPNRRLCERVTISHDKQMLHITTGFNGQWRDGEYCLDPDPSETFISVARLVGSDFEASCRDIAVLVSLAIQYGAPLEVLRHAMTRLDDGTPEKLGTPAGAGGTVLDLIAREGRE